MKNAVSWDIQTQFIPHRRHYFTATELSRLMICKIWGFHGGDYEECRLLGYKNPVHTSQETHYFSATELSRLMLCKIWGYLGGNYEECRLLGYKNPVHTSQETHHVSATDLSLLVRIDVSEEPGASIINLTGIGELGTKLTATDVRCEKYCVSSISLQWVSVVSYC
jgi:hypothetical protein